MQNRIIVIGGGAAGMMAAIYASRAGADVVLLEKNEKLGKKLYITGKGRCNVTNASEREDFLRHVFRNPRFLYASLVELDNEGLMRLIESEGVPLKTERGNRVFPVSDHSSDIILALKRAMGKGNVDVRLNACAESLLMRDGCIAGVRLETGETVSANAVIVATGGVSYPSTGSTGDGYRFAEAAGHTIETPRASLTPIETRESWPANLMGLALKNVRLTAHATVKGKEKALYSEMGEMLFTHFGISGPLVLTLSCLMPENPESVRLEIDLKPALDEATLDARLVRDFRELSRKQLVTAMDSLVPHNLGLQLLLLAHLSAAAPINGVTAEQRKSLVRLLKAVPLTPKRLRGFDEAIITRGGVNVKEVNPKTLESKCVSGLYFAGEVLDLDAATGGYNLQIAFSTGALAGKSAAESIGRAGQ